MDTSTALTALAALSHESRLAIFRLLVEQGPLGIAAGDIAANLDLPAATTSFHLKELVHAGLASARPQSRFIYYSASYEAMNGLVAYLTDNCCRHGTTPTDCPPGCVPRALPIDKTRAIARRRSPPKSHKRRAA